MFAFLRRSMLVLLLGAFMLPFSLVQAQGEVFDTEGASTKSMKIGSDLMKEEIKKAQNVSVDKSFPEIVVGWTNFLMSAVAIIAVLTIIWAGVRYITSLGDDTARESAQKIIIYTVIGLLVIFAAFALTNTLIKGIADNEPDDFKGADKQAPNQNFLQKTSSALPGISLTAAVFKGDGVTGGSTKVQAALSDDMSKETSLKSLIEGWVNFAIRFISLFCVVVLVWAGTVYVTAVGDDSKKEQAQKIIIFTVVGLVVILAAYAIVNSIILGKIDP